MYRELESYHVDITLYDPHASAGAVADEYGITLAASLPSERTFDAIILAVAHQEFVALDVRSMGRENAVLFDVKAAWPRSWGALRL